MVGDGHPLEVGRQWVIRPRNAPDVARVVDGGVEIGVVGHLGRHAVNRPGLRDQAGLHGGLGVRCRVAGQQCKQGMAQCGPGFGAGGHEGVQAQHRLARHRRCFQRRRREAGQQFFAVQRSQVKHLVADSDTGSPRQVFAAFGKHGVGQVLDGEVRVAIGRGQPAAGGGIVGVVDCVHTEAINLSSKIATARVQPADAPRILCGKQEM